MKYFTDRKFLPHSSAPHVHFLFPWWGVGEEEIYKGHKVYDRYLASAADWYEPVDHLEQADFAVLPSNLKYYKKYNQLGLIDEMLNECKKGGKKLVIFFKGDSDEEVELDEEHCIIFRTSFYKSTKRANEFAMPVWSGDLVDIYNGGVFEPKAIQGKFRFGFCGQTLPAIGFPGLVWRMAKYKLSLLAHIQGLMSARKFGKRWFSFLRADSLRILNQENSFQCDFVERSGYLGGAWIRKGSFDLARYQGAREDYIENLKRNDFFPCVRGGGNYSLRIYEVLCLGKIPVLIDTDSVLPFPNQIDWSSHLIIVPSEKLFRISKLLSSELRDLNNDKFKAWQARNRALWLNYLSPDGFFKNIQLIIRGANE